MRTIMWCAFALFVGCAHRGGPQTAHPLAQKKMAAILALERETLARQAMLAEKYERFLSNIKGGLGLPADATWDAFRTALAKTLGCEDPKNTAWETLLAHPTIAAELTEEKRAQFADAFGLSPHRATWPEIRDAVEAWKQAQRRMRR